MGITLRSKNCTADMGYGGFLRFRSKVAELVNEEFGNHYEDARQGSYLDGEKRAIFFNEYDAKTEKLIEDNIVTREIANFCYQPDVEGSIDQRQAKQIYEVIKDYDDNICYGYAGRPDCAMFSDLKRIFKDGAETRKYIRWS